MTDSDASARPPLKVVLLGAGTVGLEVARLLVGSAADLAARVGAPLELVGVAVRDASKPREGLDPARNVGHFEPTRAAEGLYIKIEEDGRVVERLKFVRPDFVQRIIDADQHWHSRPIVPNVLVPGADIYAPDLHWLDEPSAGPTP